MNQARILRRDALYDLLVANPTGITVDDMMDLLDVSYETARKTIRDLRRFLGDDDEINVPCTPNGMNERWLYTLEATLENSQEWISNRLGDAESRLETMAAMTASLVRSTDGRSIEGKKARILDRAFRRAAEDLADLNA